MTQFLITALGSYGDVHPMVGLGSALAARGHRVKIVTNPYFEDVVDGRRPGTVAAGHARRVHRAVAASGFVASDARAEAGAVVCIGGEMLRPLYDLLVANYVPGETVFCAHAHGPGQPRGRREACARRWRASFSPGVLWSVHDSPRLKGALLGPRVPQWLKRLQFWMADRLFVVPLLGPQLNGLRRELGLPPVQRVFREWLFETDLVLGLFPDWFGPPQPDWPANTRLVGFPLWDRTTPTPSCRDEVHEFLAAGSPPIAFSPGSANREAHQFFAAAVEACERLGRRGILLTKYADQLPAEVARLGAPFRLRAAEQAAAAHGRAGASRRHRQLRQGFAAGVPHIVRPMSYDQFDNSRRLVRLGVAEEISVRQFSRPSDRRRAGALLASPTVAASAASWRPAATAPPRSPRRAMHWSNWPISTSRGRSRVDRRRRDTSYNFRGATRDSLTLDHASSERSHAMSHDQPLADLRFLMFVGDDYEDLELWYPKLRLDGGRGACDGRRAEGRDGLQRQARLSVPLRCGDRTDGERRLSRRRDPGRLHARQAAPRRRK